MNTSKSTDSFKDDSVLSFHDSLLRRSDVALLQGPHWLNDQIISFYFEYLERVVFVDTTSLLFVSPEVTQCIKMMPADIQDFLGPLDAANKSFIFFPFNNHELATAGGTHWSLLVFSRPEETFYHFDSAKFHNFEQCEQFVSAIKYGLECHRATMFEMDCLQQANGYDCGIHVLCNADNVGEYIRQTNCVVGVPKLKREHVSTKRRVLLRLIDELSGKIPKK